MRDALATAAVAAASAAALRDAAGRDPWAPDSYDYLIRVLMRTGVPFAAARERARAFFATTAFGRDPVNAHVFSGDEPEWFPLFAPRMLYPALAALVYPYRGAAALADVSRAAAALAPFALYRLLRRCGPPELAALATLAYAGAPQVRAIGGAALTDAAAMLGWIVALDGAVEIAAGAGGWTRFALASSALALTRPLTYLPLGAGLALAASGAAARAGARMRAGAAIVAVAAAQTAVVAALARRAGMPPAAEHLERVRAAQRRDDARDPGSARFARLAARLGGGDPYGGTLGQWYARNVALTTLAVLYRALRDVGPVVGATGLLAARREPAAPVLAGALLGAAAGIVADPVPSSSHRTVIVPLYPVAAAAALLGARTLLRRR